MEKCMRTASSVSFSLSRTMKTGPWHTLPQLVFFHFILLVITGDQTQQCEIRATLKKNKTHLLRHKPPTFAPQLQIARIAWALYDENETSHTRISPAIDLFCKAAFIPLHWKCYIHKPHLLDSHFTFVPLLELTGSAFLILYEAVCFEGHKNIYFAS